MLNNIIMFLKHAWRILFIEHRLPYDADIELVVLLYLIIYTRECLGKVKISD